MERDWELVGDAGVITGLPEAGNRAPGFAGGVPVRRVGDARFSRDGGETDGGAITALGIALRWK